MVFGFATLSPCLCGVGKTIQVVVMVQEAPSVLFYSLHSIQQNLKNNLQLWTSPTKKNLIDKDENGELNTRFILTSAY